MPLGATRFGFQAGDTEIDVSYLVIAGGGQGGDQHGGGGGAGGKILGGSYKACLL